MKPPYPTWNMQIKISQPSKTCTIPIQQQGQEDVTIRFLMKTREESIEELII